METNDIFDEVSAQLDEELSSGPVVKNGIFAEDDSLWYYVDGLRTGAGVIEIDGYYYYARSDGEIVHGRDYWTTQTNGLIPEKTYSFDDEGRILGIRPSTAVPSPTPVTVSPSPRPFLSTPLNDFDVQEGLLLSILLVLIITSLVKVVKEAFTWL